MDSPLIRRLLLLCLGAGAAVLGLRLLDSWKAGRAEADLAAAEAAMERKDYAGALAALGREGARLDKAKRYRALCLKADALDRLKRPQEAVSALEAAVTLDPKPWDAPYGLARMAMLDLKSCAAGLKTLEAAVLQPEELYWSKAKERPNIYRLRWRCRQSLGELELAIAAQGQELALRMGGGEAGGEEVRYVLANRAWSNYMLYERLMARLAKGEWRQVYQERYGRDPGAAPVDGQMAGSDPKSLAEAVPFSDLNQAESDATAALAIRDDPRLRLLRARILVAAAKTEPAMQDLGALAADAQMARSAEYWLLTASAQGQRKNYREALAAVDRSLALDPSNSEAVQMRPMLLELLSKASPPKGRRRR